MEEKIEEMTELDEDVEATEELTEEEMELADDIEDDDTDEDTDLEYDEEGNIVIGDDETNADDEESPETESSTEETAKELTADEWKQKFQKLESQTKETLKKYGVDTDDAIKGLERMAAEADGVTEEEYVTQREAKKAADEKIYAEDLAAIKAIYPETANLNHISELKNVKRFAELRNMGLSATEAYSASHSKEVREGVARSVKTQQKSGKEHLHSVVPKTTRGGASISRSDMDELRDLFPNKTDKEIIELYKKTL